MAPANMKHTASRTGASNRRRTNNNRRMSRRRRRRERMRKRVSETGKRTGRRK